MFTKRFCWALLLIGFSRLTFQASTPEDSFYVAGVVEFRPAAPNQASLDQVNDNVRGYLDILLSAEAAATDIIVFPELTLNNVLHLTYVPDPVDKITPCGNNEYQPFLQELACAAKNLTKYIVINLLEKENCTTDSQAHKNDPRPCALNGLSTFNTNVVLNRDGVVVSRYRKYNIYGEPRNVTYTPEISTFETDFGVKFGLFICFDINFYSPAIDLVKLGVKDLIYTAFWYSELPFLTATQIQESWAYANEVNLLAAGASYPLVGSTGSGIYAGKQGRLVSVMARSAERKLYVANVTKSTSWGAEQPVANRKDTKSTKRSLNGLQLMQEYRISNFTSQHLKLSLGTEVEEQICHDGFCCKFSLKLKKLNPSHSSTSYQYHMMVFNGDREYSGSGYTKYRLCAVCACLDDSLESCGQVFNDIFIVSSEYAFESILIEGDFPKADKVLIMPSTLDQDLNPLTVEQFEFGLTDGKSSQHVRHELLTESDNLLTFGIYANYYDEKSAASILSVPVVTTFLGVFVVGIAFNIAHVYNN